MNISSNGQTLGFKFWQINIPHISQKVTMKIFLFQVVAHFYSISFAQDVILVTYITQPTKGYINIHKFWECSNLDHIFNDGQSIKGNCK